MNMVWHVSNCFDKVVILYLEILSPLKLLASKDNNNMHCNKSSSIWKRMQCFLRLCINNANDVFCLAHLAAECNRNTYFVSKSCHHFNRLLRNTIKTCIVPNKVQYKCRGNVSLRYVYKMVMMHVVWNVWLRCAKQRHILPKKMSPLQLPGPQAQ